MTPRASGVRVSEAEVTTTPRFRVQEQYKGVWMLRQDAHTLKDAEAAVTRRLDEWPERVYRVIEETHVVTRRVVVQPNEPGKPKPKTRTPKDPEPDTMDPSAADEGTQDQDDSDSGDE